MAPPAALHQQQQYDTTRTAQATSQSRDRLDDTDPDDSANHASNESTRLLPWTRSSASTTMHNVSSSHAPRRKSKTSDQSCCGRAVFPFRTSVAALSVLAGIGFVALIAAIRTLSFHGQTSWITSRSSESSSDPEVLFDYIVVGAGPAGIITAVSLARLLPNQTILLIEAGTTSQASVLNRVQEHTLNQKRKRSKQPQQKPFTTTCSSSPTTTPMGLNEFDVPLLWSGVAASSGGATRTTESAVLDEGLLHAHRGHRSRSMPLPPQPIHDHHWPIGRTLLGKNIGGSGVHNAMIYIRSLAADWNRWNITGWDYTRDIVPTYRALERLHHGTETKATTATNWRGQAGPITTTPVDMNRVDAVATLFVESAIQAGIPSRIVSGFNVDEHVDNITMPIPPLNADQPKHHPRVGAGYYEFNIRHGIRDSVARAFLGDSSALPIPDNLWIESGVTVTRVLFDESTHSPPHPATKTRKRPNLTQSNRHPRDQQPSDPPRVIGVEYVRTGPTSVVLEDAASTVHNRVGQFLLRHRRGDHASRSEVILAAGAIMTPQLLVNSGIGDRDDASAGRAQSGTNATVTSPIKVHLPGVGKNLQDHPVVTMGFEIDAELALMGSVSSIYTIGSEMDEYFWSAMELDRLHSLNQSMYTQQAQSETTIDDLTFQLGTLGTPGFSAGCFLRSPFSTNNETAPDIQITVFPRHMEPHVTRQTQQGGRDYLRLLRNKAMLVTVALLSPEARFEVKASRSSIPLVPWDDPEYDNDHAETIRARRYRLPEIDLPYGQRRYLTERDIQRLAWGLEQVRLIQAEAPLANHVGPEMYPGANVRGRELRDYIRNKSLPNAHWAGTTRMSSDVNDAQAVVDERLRVRGVRGLRIVDAGVLPTVPNGNLHSTVCVIAHQAASLIAHDRMRTLPRAA